MSYSYLSKIIIIGESGVGKTHIASSFCQENYCQLSFQSTIGVDYLCKTITLNNMERLKFQIWDTAGQERFQGITQRYYNVAHAILIVYDTTDRKSFQRLPYWIAQSELFAAAQVPIYIIGTKKDLTSEKEVFFEEGKAFADSMKFIFYEVSSRDQLEICKMFNAIGHNLYHSPQVFLNCPIRSDSPTKKRKKPFCQII